MTRRAKAEQASGYTVLLVDDNPDYLQATRLLLEREGHDVLTATNGPEALDILPRQKVDLLLLDYFMPGMTGEQVVAELRKFDPFVQVILQTGYASEQPPRELLHRLNIQGYYDKTEGPEQLLLWTTVGLKAAQTIQLLFKSRRGVGFILEHTPDLHRTQSSEQLAGEILAKAIELLAAMGAGADVSGFVATLEAAADLVVRAGTGPFGTRGKVSEVLGDQIARVDAAMQRANVQIDPVSTIIPLRVGPLTVGVLYLDQPVVGDQALELVCMFANQAAVAIHNAALYEMSRVDPLTGTFVRTFFEHALLREISASFREKAPVALALIDVDGMTAINEGAGHVAGDRALKTLGAVLEQATRGGDVVGRYGSDAFGVVLRDPSVVGPARLAARVHELLKDRVVVGSVGETALRVSIGFSLIEAPSKADGDVARPIGMAFFQSVSERLKASAALALEEARREGGDTVRGAAPIAWPPV
ncbi:MAG TPA: diguanylate cyclase [Polyangiaceae bacterium]|nr:diguanylate cyclase [Polyangiaceae bacterium]